MIDFVSTRAGTDPATRAVASMVAAAIAQFVRDASTRPTADEKKQQRNLNWDARRAIVYLFEPGSAFETHIELIGGSAAPLRAALLDRRELSPRSSFTPLQRRIIQARHRWWVRHPEDVSEQPEEETEL